MTTRKRAQANRLVHTLKTNHARVRQQQRGISNREVDLTLDWGRQIPLCSGATAYHLGRKQRAIATRAGHDLNGIKDLAVLVGSDEVVITTYHCTDMRRLRRIAR